MMSRIKQFNGFKVVKGIINNYKCNSNYCDSKCQLKTNLKINQLSLSIVIICYKKIWYLFVYVLIQINFSSF